jgi:glyoxylase-like metal-dependent hydrolase (beta-lactamase superfamily II)
MVKYISEKISEHITRIITPCNVCVYLVQGSVNAALLDTGFGIGDLKGYVETLVHTPYVVLLSHGHLDHAGGAAQFEQIYLNAQDLELEKWHCTLERRIFDVRNGPGGMPNGVVNEDFQPSRTAPYLSLNEGDDFTLGGVTVRPIAVPGHTKGMLVFLIPEDRIAIFGDACGEQTLLTYDALPVYRKGLMHMQEFEDEFDTVLRNHGTYWSKKAILADNLELCGEILDGRDAAFPMDFHGVKGFLGRPLKHPGKEGNIFYAMSGLDNV